MNEVLLWPVSLWNVWEKYSSLAQFWQIQRVYRPGFAFILCFTQAKPYQDIINKFHKSFCAPSSLPWTAAGQRLISP
jgi:hypothetical protein